MATVLLLALLCLTVAGFTCAAAWSHPQADHARRWDAAFALVIGASGAELVLLGSPLGLLFPWAAALGLIFPMLAGPFWWRSRHGRQHWSWRRWVLQLVPGAALLVSTVATVADRQDAFWSAGSLPSAGLVIVAALANLAAGAVRRPRTARAARPLSIG
ncbi:MAG TPA: hypothetical protein VLF18_17270 [Tahibacter sp.]|uniref:hypothetical protein n=1 Tax=Tahibacter sp. TaxID=2056211 RepID=UPI002CEB19FB|nr:hypothetical protein [Tahibacter sp.]HSX61941.1 hypothetical protein [Tahibacter sp.]